MATTPEEQQKPRETMVSGTVGLIRLFGVPVRLHFTFLLLLVFLIFIGIGERQSGATTVVYILALFGSVLLHELGHTLVSRGYGIRTLEIVMFPIGGVSRPERSPKGREELWIALAGPFVNLIIAGGIVAWLTAKGALVPIEQLAKPTDANLAQRIAVGNLILAAFNLLPAFPMDGGRVLRGLLSRWRSEEDATRIAAGAGRLLAVLMGLFGLISANYLLVFIAMFVYLGAAQEAALAVGRQLTSGFQVKSAMITDFRTLSHGDTIRDAGDLLLATSQHDFPVMHGDQVVGLLGRAALMRAMLKEGPDSYVAGAMDRNFVPLPPDMQLSEALPRLSAPGSCALVMDAGRLLGMVTGENLSEFILLRQASLAQAKGQSR